MKQNRPAFYEARYTAAAPLPLQEYLRVTAKISGRSLRKYFFKGLIEVNQRRAHSAAVLKPGDVVKVYPLPESAGSLAPERLPIDIIFEDENLLVLNKPALIPVHPSGAITSGTLANRVAHYFCQKGYPLKVRPVNRLDYGTSGLIIFAKSASIQARLSEAIQNHQIARIYYAIVEGIPAETEGKIDLPIIDHPTGRRVAPEGKPSVTGYRVMESWREASLLELSLMTGRTHQIRIHLSHIGHPIVGDKTYGKPSKLINRPALHAGKLIFYDSSFNIPGLDASFPEDFNRLIHQLKGDSRSDCHGRKFYSSSRRG